MHSAALFHWVEGVVKKQNARWSEDGRDDTGGKAVMTLLFLFLHRLGAEERGRQSHPHFVPVERFPATRLLAKVTKRGPDR